MTMSDTCFPLMEMRHGKMLKFIAEHKSIFKPTRDIVGSGKGTFL